MHHRNFATFAGGFSLATFSLTERQSSLHIPPPTLLLTSRLVPHPITVLLSALCKIHPQLPSSPPPPSPPRWAPGLCPGLSRWSLVMDVPRGLSVGGGLRGLTRSGCSPNVSRRTQAMSSSEEQRNDSGHYRPDKNENKLCLSLDIRAYLSHFKIQRLKVT